MGNRLTRHRRRPAPARPSWFFLVALAIGVILLAWVAITFINTPVTPR